MLLRVMFKGSLDGEFWYRVNLESLNPEIINFPLMECEVGRLVLNMLDWLSLNILF